MKRCNKLNLDTGALMAEQKDTAVEALHEEGEALMDIMRHEVRMTTAGGTPGRTAWRDHMADNIEHVGTVITPGKIEMEFGYSPDDEADETRAMVVAYGSGDKAAGGGRRIHAGPPGRKVWDRELSGRKSSEAKSAHEMPEAFNQRGNLFVDNAIRRVRGRFGGRVEAAFTRLPSSVFYRKVSVRKP